MKKLVILIIIAILGYAHTREQGISIPGLSTWNNSSDTDIQTAYDNRQSNLQVQGEGIVKRVLADDLEGSRHQRFILKLSTGQTLLVAHNIDLAPRISGLTAGDKIEFYGEYEWNSKGDVIHWTHRDPNNHHIGGWLKHKSRTYQ